jgi:acyl-CoA synthetase (AMP-forming)/AMP-acid ligase II
MNYGASPIGEGLLKKALAVFACDFQQSYGMTETGAAICQLTVADHKKALAGRSELLKSCGRENAASQMRVVDQQGRVVADGELGEIVVKSTTNMMGYWRLPEQTAETLRDGWLYTGDIGYRDEEGYYFLMDRKKDVVVSGGENIYPNEVERVLLLHDAINDVAVIGVPDEKYGESLLACCVMKPGQALDEAALIAYCRDHLAGYKIPRQYQVLEELPRNPSGKVLKTQLREPYWQHVDRRIS